MKLIYKSDGFLTPIYKQDLLNNLNTEWEYYNKLIDAKDIPIFVFKLDFNDPFITYKNGFYSILKNFEIEIQEFEEQNISNEEKIKLYNNFFIDYCKGDTGFIFPIDEQKAILYLNTNSIFKATLKTVSHELVYYFQYLLNVDIVDTNINISHYILGYSVQEINYLFSKKEFIPHIKSDLCLTLKMIYSREKVKDKYLTIEDFINTVIDNIKSDPQNVKFSYIWKLWNQYNKNDFNPLMLFVATIILNRNDLFVQICEIIKKFFKLI